MNECFTMHIIRIERPIHEIIHDKDVCQRCFIFLHDETSLCQGTIDASAQATCLQNHVSPSSSNLVNYSTSSQYRVRRPMSADLIRNKLAKSCWALFHRTSINDKSAIVLILELKLLEIDKLLNELSSFPSDQWYHQQQQLQVQMYFLLHLPDMLCIYNSNSCHASFLSL